MGTYTLEINFDLGEEGEGNPISLSESYWRSGISGMASAKCRPPSRLRSFIFGEDDGMVIMPREERSIRVLHVKGLVLWFVVRVLGVSVHGDVDVLSQVGCVGVLSM